jgi:hypothetical protein
VVVSQLVAEEGRDRDQQNGKGDGGSGRPAGWAGRFVAGAGRKKTRRRGALYVRALVCGWVRVLAFRLALGDCSCVTTGSAGAAPPLSYVGDETVKFNIGEHKVRRRVAAFQSFT